jgi:hypothetical protein
VSLVNVCQGLCGQLEIQSFSIKFKKQTFPNKNVNDISSKFFQVSKIHPFKCKNVSARERKKQNRESFESQQHYKSISTF